MNQKKIIYPKFSPTDKQNAALAPKEKMNEAKLFIFLKDLPEKTQEQLLSLTWEEAFALASDAESFRKEMPVYDPAFAKFSNDEHLALKLAELLEHRERYMPSLLVNAD